MSEQNELQALPKVARSLQQDKLLQLKNSLFEKVGTAQAIVLLGKTPKSEVRSRLMNPRNPEGENNPRFFYVEHAYVEQVLNYAFQLQWNVKCISKERVGEEALVEILLSVKFKDGNVVEKTGFGGAKHLNNPNMSWGDVFKSAYSDAIKNAATKLGIALDLYRSEEVQQEKLPDQPITNNVQDSKPATDNQKATIKNILDNHPELARGQNYDFDKMTFGQASETIKTLSSGK
jgi:hypothetical protein